MQIAYEKLEKLVADIFAANGAPEKDAMCTAEIMVKANLCGVDSHGVQLTELYVEWIKKGLLVPGAPITVMKESASTCVLDVGYNFGHVGAAKAVEIVAEKASQTGAACVVTRNCRHVGRLGEYTGRLAERGLLAFGSVALLTELVAPFGSREPKLGTNPLSYAAPSNNAPVLMDLATSSVAGSKIVLAGKKGDSVPEGLILDKNGNPSTDPAAFSGGGSLLPMGGLGGTHKGSALSILTEAFGSLLAGEEHEKISRENQGYTYNSLFILAIDPKFFFGLEDYKEKMGIFTAFIKAASPALGFSEVLMPGEIEANTADVRRSGGIPLPDTIWDSLTALAEKCDVEIPL